MVMGIINLFASGEPDVLADVTSELDNSVNGYVDASNTVQVDLSTDVTVTNFSVGEFVMNEEKDEITYDIDVYFTLSNSVLMTAYEPVVNSITKYQ